MEEKQFEVAPLKVQLLKRKSGVPFVFKGAQFPNAVLVLADVKEFAGSRDLTVIIEATAFADEENIDMQFKDYLRKYQYTFTRNSLTVREFGASGQVTNTSSVQGVNAEALNLIVNDVHISMFKYDTEYHGGKVFTDAGLQALLTLPSISEQSTLSAEWELPVTE